MRAHWGYMKVRPTYADTFVRLFRRAKTEESVIQIIYQRVQFFYRHDPQQGSAEAIAGGVIIGCETILMKQDVVTCYKDRVRNGAIIYQPRQIRQWHEP